MSVKIQPSGTLGFHRPLTQLVKRTLTVSNPNSQPVAFKVKTTAPKQYCVRPNSGRIEPGEQVEVQVLLQPMQADPEQDAKCRDKFLVQSAIITPERESRPLNELWSMIDKDDKNGISEYKIRCAYLPPLEADPDASTRSVNNSSTLTHSTSSQNGLNEKAASVGGTPVPDKAARHDDAEAKHLAPSTLDRIAPAPPFDSSRDAHPHSGSELTAPFKSAIANPLAASGVTGSGHGGSLNQTHSAVSTPHLNGQTSEAPTIPAVDVTKLQTELTEAKREIERLNIQLAEAQTGLRQRHVAASLPAAAELKAPGEMVVHGDAGIPLQTFMIAIGVTFVFTWLFF